MLEPISSTHSISRVIANFFLAQSFAKPKFVFDKLLDKGGLFNYQKKGLTSSKTINIENDSLNISNDSNNGFLFEEFDELGKSINVLKVENIHNNKAIISFENRKYSNWSDFKNRFISDLQKFSTIFDVYIEAIGLTYIDEFVWKSDDNIDVYSIFNENAELINKKFLDSYNGTLVSVFQSGHIEEVNFCEEKTEIVFNNQLKRIIINHTYALKLKEVSVFSDEKAKSFIEYFDKAHQANKDILNDILTEHVKSIINLK
jgi:uncharacterized protein (TIGR04255 family)